MQCKYQTCSNIIMIYWVCTRIFSLQKVIIDYVTERKIRKSHSNNCIFITQLYVYIYICNMLVILNFRHIITIPHTLQKDEDSALTAHI